MTLSFDRRRTALPPWMATALAPLLLAGCASFSPDGGAEAVSALTRGRTGQAIQLQRSAADVEAARARANERLREPLSAERAVEVALLNHRGLQASLSALGVAEAERVRAGRWANPSLKFGRLAGPGVTEIDRSLTFNLLGLLTLPVASDFAQGQLEQAQVQAAYEVVGVAAEARLAFFRAVAAQQLLVYYEQVHEAAEAASELAARMQAAGNFSALARMREQAFHAEATVGLARARHQAVAERERLVRALGLSGEQLEFTLPAQLPELPATPLAPQDAERTALEMRLDVQMARRAAEATARSLGLTRSTRFINVLEAGYANKSQTGEPRQNGVEIELQLPLFDFGQARVARAEALYMQAVHRAAEVAVNARSEVRQSYSAYRTAFELARHYRDEWVPLRKRISDENLLRYNGMLASVFELLADARDQIATVTAAVEALRDSWIAETQLQTALTGRSPGAGPLAGPAPAAATEAGSH